MTAIDEQFDEQTALPIGVPVDTKPREDSRIPALIVANLALIVTVIFGAGVTYARVGSIEVRVSAIEAREAQLDALSAIQSQLQTLKEEMMRARDRLDRAADLENRKAR